MQGKEIADSGLQLERIVSLVARKGSIVEVTGYSTGVFNIPYPLLLLFYEELCLYSMVMFTYILADRIL